MNMIDGQFSPDTKQNRRDQVRTENSIIKCTSHPDCRCRTLHSEKGNGRSLELNQGACQRRSRAATLSPDHTSFWGFEILQSSRQSKSAEHTGQHQGLRVQCQTTLITEREKRGLREAQEL